MPDPGVVVAAPARTDPAGARRARRGVALTAARRRSSLSWRVLHPRETKENSMAMPESIPAPLIIDTFKDIFRAERRGQRRQEPLGWIISVPDTHQKSVLAALDKERDVVVLTCSTEDEANGVAAGLWMTGEPVIVMIQHAGLYASVNTLRGIAIDGRVPIFYMIGLLSREEIGRAHV